MQRTQAELKAMFQHLTDAPMYWFDPRAGQDNISYHAWRAIAYYVAEIESTSPYIEYTNDVLSEFEADKFATDELVSELKANNIP